MANPGWRPTRRESVVYPDSDGEPMADNTLQFSWIVLVKENLDVLFPDAFVGGDLLWYPVEGDPKTRIGPDALVALGRPKGYRGSYKTWEEGGVVPQVVFEIWSPKNGFNHRLGKLRFYDRHGVAEFYAYDPQENELSAFIRGPGGLEPVSVEGGWTSPALGIHFEPGADNLVIRGPDGQAFRSLGEERERAAAAAARAEEERARAEEERERAAVAAAQAEEERARAEEERARAAAAAARAEEERERAAVAAARAEEERARADALAAKLRALGIDPDTL